MNWKQRFKMLLRPLGAVGTALMALGGALQFLERPLTLVEHFDYLRTFPHEHPGIMMFINAYFPYMFFGSGTLILVYLFVRPESGRSAPAPTAAPTSHQSLEASATLPATAPIDWTLRDRRQAAYDMYVKFLHVVDLKYELDMDAIRQFVMDIRETRFLFGEDIYNYLSTIYSKVLEHRSVRQRMATGANFSNGELASLADKDNRFTAWLTGQHGEMARRFAPYLDVSERK